jgi:hypothetical protein
MLNGGARIFKPYVQHITSCSKRHRCSSFTANKGEKKNVYRILVGRAKAKKPLGKPRHI